jgi:hypothetical protein
MHSAFGCGRRIDNVEEEFSETLAVGRMVRSLQLQMEVPETLLYQIKKKIHSDTA